MRLQSLVRAILIMVVGIAAAVAAEPPPKTVIYLGATLIDATVPAPRQSMAIITAGDRIVAVRSAAGFVPQEGDEVLDVRNKFIVPGLVNTHVHLATLADPPVARAYLRRELYSGVTTVRDMAGDVRLLGELKREAQFNEAPSADIYYVAAMAGPAFFVDHARMMRLEARWLGRFLGCKRSRRARI